MIKSISISDVATFDRSGVAIENLKKINFIYGANGTGKTTITNFLQETSNTQFSNCTIDWQHAIPLQTLVYNKSFRERNFRKGKIDGIFTLGEATKEEKIAIEQMVKDLADIKNEGIEKNESKLQLTKEKKKLDDNFREAAWINVYKKHELFKEAFRGAKTKETFKNKLIDQSSTNTSDLKSYEEIKVKAATLFGETPTSLPPLQEIDFSRLIEIESNHIWEKKIVGKGNIEISKLIQHLNLNDWVNEGRNYMQDANVCPFCQQKTITSSFRKQLDEYFDKQFTQDTESVKTLSEEYMLISQNLTNLLQELEASERANGKTKLNLDTLVAYNKTASTQMHSNKELLSNKRKEPSRSINLISLSDQLEKITELVTEGNTKIKDHNAIVQNYDIEKKSLTQSIWRYLVEEYKANIEIYEKNTSAKQKGIDSLAIKSNDLRKKYSKLNSEIREANKNVTSVQPSIDEINRVLKSYGFLNFEIVPDPKDKNQYQIHREDGSTAETTLSEGEITFITFLYFLQLAKGGLSKDSVSNDRILVIDDPISSLDSNVLFVVSSLIKKIVNSIKKSEGNIKQLILLTHNVYFHKEVSYAHGKSEDCNNTFFWILRKKSKVTTIQPYEMHNPIHNSYELLWRELGNRNHNDGITIQNIMRRIIESYFKILGKYRYDDLIDKFATTDEREICRSMICWINDGSHGIPDDLYIEHPETTIDKYFDVFENIFINMKHHEHFKMMMGVSNSEVSAV